MHARASNRDRWLFVAAAVWNIGAGLCGLVAPQATAKLLYRAATLDSETAALFAWSDFSACVLLFGVGYAMVARDTARNHGLIWLGIAGKLGVVATWSYRFAVGAATPLVFVPVSIDLVFALAFVRFLSVARAGRDAV